MTIEEYIDSLEKRHEALVQIVTDLTVQVMQDIATLRKDIAELRGLGLEEYLTIVEKRVRTLEALQGYRNGRNG